MELLRSLLLFPFGTIAYSGLVAEKKGRQEVGWRINSTILVVASQKWIMNCSSTCVRVFRVAK